MFEAIEGKIKWPWLNLMPVNNTYNSWNLAFLLSLGYFFSLDTGFEAWPT